MPSWQRAQVTSPTFCADTGEFGSVCALMEWMPWQSVHTGACQFPLAMACPWMLCWNSLEIVSWHCPQVVGTLNLKIGDFASLASRISCVPWQSVQTAAFSDPAETACPCTLAS